MENIEIMEKELAILVMKGDCNGVNELVKGKGIEVLRGVTPQGNSALHVAAAQGHHQMVEVLAMLMPCMLFKRNSNEDTPLHAAARFGNSETVQALLNVQNGLQCKCSSPCPKRVDLEASPKQVQEIWMAQNKDGETALHYAVKGNNLKAVEMILNNVQDLKLIANHVGESPLYTACYYGRLDMIRNGLLSVHPAEWDPRKDGTSCLHQAISNILEWWDEGNNYSSWCERGKRRQYHDFALELAFQLVDKRPQLANSVDRSGNSPLHLLVKLQVPHESHLKLVDKLLDAEPFMNFKKNEHDMAPLHIAARDGHVKVIRRLINSAPHCSYLLGKEKKNVLHFAIERDDGFSLVSKVLWLLQDPVDVGFLLNEPDNEGNTALCKAKMRLNEGSVVSLWQYFAYRILLRMSRTSRPCPNNFTKSNASKSSQLDLEKVFAVQEAKGEQSEVDEEKKDTNKFFICKLSIDAAAAQSEKDVEKTDGREKLSVVAALIATITFAAAFTIPGGFNAETGNPVFIREAAFKTFILCDSLAFSLSLLSLLNLSGSAYWVLAQLFGQCVLMKRVGNRKNFEQQRAWWGSQLLALSLDATMVAFATGLYVVVAPNCQWLAVTVCTTTIGGLLYGNFQTLSLMIKLLLELELDIFRLTMDMFRLTMDQ